MKSKILPLTVLKRLTSGHDELIIDLINPEWSVFRWGSSIQCGHHKCHIHPQARNWHKVTRQQLMDGLKSKHCQRLVFFLTVLTLRAEKMATSRSQSLNFLSGEFLLLSFLEKNVISATTTFQSCSTTWVMVTTQSSMVLVSSSLRHRSTIQQIQNQIFCLCDYIYVLYYSTHWYLTFRKKTWKEWCAVW